MTTSTLYVWRVDATSGLDSAWVHLGEDGLVAEGRIAALSPEPRWVDYRLEVDAGMVTRRIAVQVRGSDDRAALEVRNDGGQWTVDGEPRPELEGALDVDLAACPLTNVMPIRRHDLVRREGRQELLMAYIELPGLRVQPNRQTYTHVRTLDDGGAVVRYESGDFRSDLTVDGEGFVVDYPHLGHRLEPGSVEGHRRGLAGLESGALAGVLDPRQRAFLAERRTATLATVSRDGRSRLVPICFVVDEMTPDATQTEIWSPIDTKPKRAADPWRLARIRDIERRPEVTLLFDRWSEEWAELGWIRVCGQATVVEPDDDREAHARAVTALRAKYPQYDAQPIDERPMIRIAVTDASAWNATPGRSER